MTQLKCPECGKEFDSTKQACPNCGCPVGLMEEIKNGQQSRIQSRMVALAKSVGILSLVSVFFIGIKKVLISITEISKLMEIAIDLGKYLGIILTFVLLMMWFLSLYKGSVKKSKMKAISIVAIIGICCIISFYVIDALASLTIDIRGQRVEGGGVTLKGFPKWIICWKICNCGLHFLSDFSDVFYVSINLLQYALIGGSFCALSKYFHGKMCIFSVLTGVGFLLRWLLVIIGVIAFSVHGEPFVYQTNIQFGLDILCYISMSMFFFEFYKTNKS